MGTNYVDTVMYQVQVPLSVLENGDRRTLVHPFCYRWRRPVVSSGVFRILLIIQNTYAKINHRNNNNNHDNRQRSSSMRWKPFRYVLNCRIDEISQSTTMLMRCLISLIWRLTGHKLLCAFNRSSWKKLWCLSLSDYAKSNF